MRTKYFLSVFVLITFLSGAFFVSNSFADSKERDEIKKAIRHKKARWSARDTKISQAPSAERKKHLGSHVPVLATQDKILAITSASVPSQLDWRNYNGNSYVTPVKEQGACSDCWAFASAAALESNKLISSNTPGVFLDLSEQTLNSCSGAGSCSGGYIDAAANFLRDIGLPLESCSPYTATDGMCSVSCSDWLTNPYKISGWYKVNPSIEAIKYALYNYGPVVALMSVYTDFYYYSTGVYEKSWGSFEGYHAVLIVGYDDAQQCFIIKDSWGEDWGEAGYGKIAYSEIASDTLFGFYTIAYETVIPSDFPELDSIPRDPNNPNTTGQDGNDNAQLSILTGSVKDASGNAISGAEIKIDKYRVTSNAAGIYVFSSLPAGSYVATVSKSGYSTLNENLTITPSDTVTKDFVISSSAQGDDEGKYPRDNGSQNIKNKLKIGNHRGFYGPGWLNVKGQAITHEQAQEFFRARREKILAAGSGKAPLAGAAADVSTDIQELARALRYDPKLIYDYVHNNIEYVSYFGSLKGATLTYLDGSGNDFDQASLMIALLNASSGKDANSTIYEANYVYGQMNIPGDKLANWLGVEQSSDAIDRLLTFASFIPHTMSTSPADGTATLDRVWVSLKINGGTPYLFDPAFKTYEHKSHINLGAAMIYNQSDILADASIGAIVTNDYTQYLNETELRDRLTKYTTNLANYLKNNYSNSEVKDIIGGRSIVKETLTAYSTTLPYVIPDPTGWSQSYIKPEYMTIFSIAVCRNLDTETTDPDNVGNCPLKTSSEIYKYYNTDDLSGGRITLSFNNSGRNPELRIDGALKATGNASTISDTIFMTVAIDHPYPNIPVDSSGLDHRATYDLRSGNSSYNHTYSIVYNFGGISDMLLQKRQKQLDFNRAQPGASDTSESVTGEALNIMGQNYLKQVAMTNRMVAGLSEEVILTHHDIGVMAQETGYYIDIRAAGFSYIPSQSNYTDWSSGWEVANLFFSGLEHGILEQLMVTDKPAVSSIKLLQIANAKGSKVYRLKHSNYSGLLNTSNFHNYPDADIPGISATLASDANGYVSYILPDNGLLQLDANHPWKGKGYIVAYVDSVAKGGEMVYVIGGQYYGGFPCKPGYVSVAAAANLGNDNVCQNIGPMTVSSVALGFPVDVSSEPVDMVGGAYLYDHTDLALGGNMPIGLAFSRSYNSNKNTSKQTLGYGFNHNYDIYHKLVSRAEPVLGNRQPLDTVGMLVALYTCLDLVKQDTPKSWMVSALTTKWGIDQLINNSIAINLGSKVTEYIKLADGTYVPPPGITTQLIDNNGTLSLQERFGTKMNFNSPDPTKPYDIVKIKEIVDADGNTATFEYNTDTNKTLKKVTDAFGRSLTFTYTSGNITSVTDSASPTRTVRYEYDNDELKRYYDAEGKLWQYGYDNTTGNKHLMNTLINPLTITTDTNVYDTLGRVKTQTMPRQGGGTAIYKFYFSGYRNQEEDPNGKTITYYYDKKGRGYAREDALGNKTTKTYDGQDHIVKVVDPRGKEIKYQYDDHGNNNLEIITNALNYSVHNTYDTQFRLTDTLDALSHNTHFDYDNEHHLLTTTDDLNNQVSNTYYANGFKWTVADPLQTTTFLTYDTYGNPLTSRTAGHNAVTYTYDTIGRITDLYDQMNPAKSTHFVYDKRGLLQSKTDMLDKQTSFYYDNAGRLSYKIDRKNVRIDYSYTPTDKIDTITYPGPSYVKFTYNNLDQLTYMEDAIGKNASLYLYDDAGRLTSMTDSNGFIIGYAYDEAGNLTTLTYPGGKTVTYTYDELNRLETVKITWLGNITASYQGNYDAAGRLLGFTNFNGTATTYGYDNASRLTSISNKAGADVISSYTFTLDANGNRTNIVQNEPYAPAIGEGDLTTYDYNEKSNRLISTTVGASTTNFNYDDEGQLKNNDTYTFDYEHRLKTISSPATIFYYDGAGNRLKVDRAGVVTKYIYDAAGRLLAEFDPINNKITRYYIYGAGLLATVTSAGDLYCYHFNGVGSTVAITDNTPYKNIVSKYSYDAFGNITNKLENASLQNQPFTYVGQAGVMTEPNGFYYMRARYYDPTVGRFISEDPIGFDGGDVNFMAYVGNNPVTGIDPSGLCNTKSSLYDKVSMTVQILDLVPINSIPLPPTVVAGAILDVGAAVFGAVDILKSDVSGDRLSKAWTIWGVGVGVSLTGYIPGAGLVAGPVTEGALLYAQYQNLNGSSGSVRNNDSSNITHGLFAH